MWKQTSAPPCKERVSIIIPYFGDTEEWAEMIMRAGESAMDQTVEVEILTVHGVTLAQARNEGAYAATGDWLIFLDADDELDPMYVERMVEGDGDIRQPSTLGVYEDGTEDDYPVLISPKPLRDGNFIVIGAMVRKDLFLQVGGFRELSAYEDWDLWLRCWLEGGEIQQRPSAIYRVHVRPNSRNAITGEQCVQLVTEIRMEYAGRQRKG